MQSRLVALLFTALFTPILLEAQTWVQTIPTSPADGSASSMLSTDRYTISVRELSVPQKARKSFDKGTRLLDGGNAAASIPEFQRAVADYRFFAEAYYQMGRAQMTLGLSQDATEAFSKAIEASDGRFALPYFALSMLLCQQDKFAEGDTVAKTGLSLDPNSLTGQFSLGWAELGLGRLVIAEKTVREVLRRKADFRQARLLLVEIHRRTKDFPELLTDIEAYLKLDGSSPTSARLRTLRDSARQSLARSVSESTLAGQVQP